MSKFKRNLVTTALPYANGPVHIGHLAGVYVPADIYVRYLRKKGEEVVFIGGSDEHGVPITIKAQRRRGDAAGYCRSLSQDNKGIVCRIGDIFRYLFKDEFQNPSRTFVCFF